MIDFQNKAVFKLKKTDNSAYSAIPSFIIK